MSQRPFGLWPQPKAGELCQLFALCHVKGLGAEQTAPNIHYEKSTRIPRVGFDSLDLERLR